MTAFILAVCVLLAAAGIVVIWSLCKIAGLNDEVDELLQEPRPVEQDDFDAWDWPTRTHPSDKEDTVA